MSAIADQLVSEIRELSDADKMRVVDAILHELLKPDHEIEVVWAEEAKKRWAAYKGGRIDSVCYEDVMTKHRE
ncbi:MAG TPA: addiction module protein [Pyrinomonadaceae bacterium]|nr:addiction module protein [Pyrinomonadaceae bacterium]